MYAFALCTDLDVPRALKVPPPLPRTVAFSPSPNAPGQFEMRQAKFFNDGQVLTISFLRICSRILVVVSNLMRPHFHGIPARYLSMEFFQFLQH
jgi:hypothetical protein